MIKLKTEGYLFTHMRLFAVMGTSSTLLLRAAFCKPWTSIVLFHTNDRNVEIFRNQMRIYSKRYGLALPTIEGFEIPPVDSLNSLSGFIEKIAASMPKNKLQVDNNDVLFYSGTVLHIRCLATLHNFRTMLLHDTKLGFHTTGDVELQCDKVSLTLQDFLEINQMIMTIENSVDERSYVSLHSKDDSWKMKSKYLLNMEFTKDKLNLYWGKPPSSTQRKFVALDCHELKEHFGQYTIIHHNLPPAIDLLMRSSSDFENEEEEE